MHSYNLSKTKRHKRKSLLSFEDHQTIKFRNLIQDNRNPHKNRSQSIDVNQSYKDKAIAGIK